MREIVRTNDAVLITNIEALFKGANIHHVVLDRNMSVLEGSIGLAIPIVVTFLQEGNVPRFPTAILATGLMLAASLSFVSGMVLDTVTRGRREVKLLAYLRYAAPGEEGRG